jgi:hypothetical protein
MLSSFISLTYLGMLIPNNNSQDIFCDVDNPYHNMIGDTLIEIYT